MFILINPHHTISVQPSTVSRLFIGTMFTDGQGEDGLAYQLPDTDSSGYGAFGQIEISPFNLECIEKIGMYVLLLYKHAHLCLYMYSKIQYV